MLGLSRQQLQAYADAHGLVWIDDPSNGDTAFARNFLRGEVLPLLRGRWPQAEANLARSAEHLGEALGLLDELAGSDLVSACDNAPLPWLGLDSLSLDALCALPRRVSATPCSTGSASAPGCLTLATGPAGTICATRRPMPVRSGA